MVEADLFRGAGSRGIRLFLAENQELVRRGLLCIFREERGLNVVGEAASGRETLRHLPQMVCDLLVMNPHPPDMDGLELLRRVKHTHPRLPVLVLLPLVEESFPLRIMKAGASGCLGRDVPAEELVRAVRRLAAGRKYLGEQVSVRMSDWLTENADALPHMALSNREYTVFLRIATGIPLSSIAREMALSPSTISTYRQRILEKMGLATNGALIRYAIEHHLLEK